MRIRPDQIAALGDRAVERHSEALVELLRQEFPEAEQVPVPELQTGVRRQMERARSYGLEESHQVNVYVVAAWLLGESFDTQFPAARAVLNATDYTPDEKIAWLEEWTQQVFADLTW